MKVATALPVFKGYTVDIRLYEFRKVTWEKGVPSMETIPFDSDRGTMLFLKYLERQLNG